MEVTVEKTGSCSARISLNVPSSEFEAEVRRGLQEIGRSSKMKGFRPGKVPMPVLEKTHGEAVRRSAVEQYLNRAYGQAVEENELEPAAHPNIQAADLVPLVGADLKTEFDVPLRPAIELGEYKGLAIESQPTDVTDEDVEAALADLRRQRSTPEPAGDAGLEEGGMLLAKVELVRGDDVLLERSGLRLGTETPLPGADPEAYKAAVLGAKEGDVVEITITFPEDFDVEEHRGQEGTGRITVEQALKIVEPTDEELQALFEAEDAASLDAKLRERIAEMKAEHELRRQESTLLERVLETHATDLPDVLVEDQVRARTEEQRQQLLQAGASPEQIEEQLASRVEEFRTSSEKSTLALFLIQAIARKEELQVAEEDLRTEFQSIAERNNVSETEVLEYYQKQQGLMNQLGMELLERKVRKFLRESAQVTPGAAPEPAPAETAE